MDRGNLAGRSPARREAWRSAVFDIYTIIFLALAVFIFVRLRSVLGQRTGRERPPYDPYSRDTARPPQPTPEGNVVSLPERNGTPPGAPLPAMSLHRHRMSRDARTSSPLG